MIRIKEKTIRNLPTSAKIMFSAYFISLGLLFIPVTPLKQVFNILYIFMCFALISFFIKQLKTDNKQEKNKITNKNKQKNI
ncbi:hypothetical protein [Bacillus toyonensis]|uniref:hypothetical protein n=1 Tax=Bacillus toyonensis TaxID=155322 RepID=UPI002E23F077|nr:hypothetical protein [Bacillus toyonensis]